MVDTTCRSGGTYNEALQKCFLCWKAEAETSFETNAFSKNNENLLSIQLSVILLLRKVLGIQQHVLSKFISKFGNPGDWGVKLCSPCARLFREAHDIHMRLLKLRSDFEGLAKEMRALLLKSFETEMEIGKNSNDETEYSTTKGRKVGQSKKRYIKPQAGDDSLTAQESVSVLQSLRKQFVEGIGSNLLELSEPTARYTTTTSINEDSCILTSVRVPVTAQVSGGSPACGATGWEYPIQKLNNHPNKNTKFIPILPKTHLNKNTFIPILPKTHLNKNTFIPILPKNHPNNNAKLIPILPKPNLTKVILITGNSQLIDKDVPLPSYGVITESSSANPETVAVKSELQTKDENADSKTDDDADHFVDEPVETGINDTGDNVSTCINEAPAAPHENEEEIHIGKEVSCATESSVEEEGGNGTEHNSAVKPKKKKIGRPTKKPSGPETHEEICERSNKKLESMITESFSKVPFEIDIQPTTENNRFKCTQCGRQFEKKFDCCIHMLKDHHEDPMPYHCHICTEKRFHSEENFRNHMTRFHPGVKCPFDEGYDPELHSPKKLVEKLILSCTSDSIEQTSQIFTSEQNEEQFLPNFPEEVLVKIRESPTETFKCRECSMKFLSELGRMGHEKRMHQGIRKAFDCDYCHYSFRNREVYIQHLCLAHFRSQVTCPLCGEKLPEKTMLEGHVRRKHMRKKAKTPYKCASCHQKFVRKKMLNIHMRRNHGTKVPVTSTSGQNSNTEKATKVVERNKTESKGECTKTNDAGTKRPYKCPFKDCTKAYISLVILNKHIANLHKSGNNSDLQEFPCSHCDSIFTDQKKLNSHIRYHGLTPYICTFCGKQCKNKSILLNHEQQMHYKELNLQPYKCDQCGRVLNNEKTMRDHMLVVHLKQPKYKCNECDYGSMARHLLERHFKTQHLKITAAICPICSATFVHAKQLTSHLRIHTGERPYKCIECGKAFADRSTLNMHKEKHKGRIHKCPLDSCPKQFNTRHALLSHVRHHQKKGIAVEIPKYRYDAEEMDQSHQNNQTSMASDNSTNSTDVV